MQNTQVNRKKAYLALCEAFRHLSALGVSVNFATSAHSKAMSMLSIYKMDGTYSSICIDIAEEEENTDEQQSR